MTHKNKVPRRLETFIVEILISYFFSGAAGAGVADSDALGAGDAEAFGAGDADAVGAALAVGAGAATGAMLLTVGAAIIIVLITVETVFTTVVVVVVVVVVRLITFIEALPLFELGVLPSLFALGLGVPSAGFPSREQTTRIAPLSITIEVTF